MAARTWLEVGARPLSRRDRAALRLALECVRWPGQWRDPGPWSAIGALGYGGEVSEELARVLCLVDESFDPAAPAARSPLRARCNARRLLRARLRARRLLRVRLALALRVLLRLDAGNLGPRACDLCGLRYSWRVPHGVRCICVDCEGWIARRVLVRPLWEQARRCGR